MAYVWDESFATGVAEIDEAHKMMFVWVNQLADAMRSGSGGGEVLRLLDLLENYASRHFAHEEGCMHEWRCPAANANKQAHAEFVAYVAKLKQECRTEGVTTPRVLELQRALGTWLRNHIMKVDVTLRDCVMHAGR